MNHYKGLQQRHRFLMTRRSIFFLVLTLVIVSNCFAVLFPFAAKSVRASSHIGSLAKSGRASSQAGSLLWRYQTGSAVDSSPTVVNGVLYIGSVDTYVYALNASSGTLLWRYQTGSAVDTSPTVVNGVLYFGSDTYVYALNASNGALLWRYQAFSAVDTSPTVVNGVVYVGLSNGYVYALTASSGSLLWSYLTGYYVDSSPTVVNGVVYFGAGDTNVYALNASSGTLLWSYLTGGNVDSSPTVVNGVLYIGSWDTYVYALNASSGTLLWRYQTGGIVESSPTAVNGVVYVGSNDSYVYALNASSGTLLWRYQTGGNVDSSPTVVNSVLYIGSNDYYVYALDASSGALLWRYQTGGSVDSSPAVAGGVLYIGSDDTYVYALSATALPPQPVQPPLAGGDVKPLETNGNGGLCFACLIKGFIQGTFGDPVNAATGNFSESATDIAIPGRGIPLIFNRTYNAQSASVNGPLGYGWTFGDNASLSVDPNTGAVTIVQENGSQVVFNVSGPTYVPAAPRDIATLFHNGDQTWTLTRAAQEKLTFSPTGQLTSQSDRNGYTTTLGYNQSSQLTTITDEAGRTLTLGYTGTHLTSVTDQATPPRTVLFGYNDGSGNLTDVTDVMGNNLHYTYDTNHLLLTKRDQRGNTVTNHYDASNRVDWQTDQLGRKTTFVYAPDGSWTTITDPKGNVTLEQYQHGLRTALTRGFGTPAQATWTFLYDPVTLGVTTATDPNGHVTNAKYDASGNPLTVTDALNRTTTYSYNSFNEVLTVQDPKQVTTTMTYDTKGNVRTKSTPCPDCKPSATQLTTYNYGDPNHPGDLTSMVDPDNKTWTYGYDPNGYRNAVTDPLGNQATSTYNAIGWKLTDVSPKGNVAGCGCSAKYTTTYSYIIPTTSKTDAFGDVQTVTDPLGHVTTYGYDADRNRTSVKDANGNTTTYVYDVANELTQTKRADKSHTTLTTDYNLDGTVLDQKDGKNTPIQTYGYDALARVTTVADALNNVTTFVYDGAGNVQTKQDPGGNCSATPKIGCTTMTYDAANQLQTITYSDGVTPNVTSIMYDPDGQRTSLTDGTGTSSWVYDSLHRLTSYTNGAGTQVQWLYNLRNLATTLTYPGSHALTQVFDDAGRLVSVTDWLSHPNTTRFGYDMNNNLTTDTFQSTVKDTYTFDAADNLTAISDKKGSTTIFSAKYTRDANNQLTSDTSIGTNQSKYKYTALNQLCYAGSLKTSACSSPPSGSYPYGYDAADNLTMMENAAHTGFNAQQFNAADELCWTVPGPSSNACGTTPTGATTYSYDTRGNRTAAVSSANAGTCDRYDQADRLTSITMGTGSTCSTPTTVGTYSYDGTGLRQSKTVSGTTTQYTWDESRALPLLLDEKAGSSNPTYYIYGSNGLPIEQITPTSSAYFYHHDQLGSTRALSDTSGTKQNTYAFDPYGNLVSSTGTISNPLRFSGQYQDNESGLIYLRARYYDPTTAQFMSQDPLSAKTRSPYAYVSGNPLNATDSLGLDPRTYEHLSMLGGQKAAPCAIGQTYSSASPGQTYSSAPKGYGAIVIENGVEFVRQGDASNNSYQVTGPADGYHWLWYDKNHGNVSEGDIIYERYPGGPFDTYWGEPVRTHADPVNVNNSMPDSPPLTGTGSSWEDILQQMLGSGLGF